MKNCEFFIWCSSHFRSSELSWRKESACVMIALYFTNKLGECIFCWGAGSMISVIQSTGHLLFMFNDNRGNYFTAVWAKGHWDKNVLIGKMGRTSSLNGFQGKRLYLLEILRVQFFLIYYLVLKIVTMEKLSILKSLENNMANILETSSTVLGSH